MRDKRKQKKERALRGFQNIMKVGKVGGAFKSSGARKSYDIEIENNGEFEVTGKRGQGAWRSHSTYVGKFYEANVNQFVKIELVKKPGGLALKGAKYGVYKTEALAIKGFFKNEQVLSCMLDFNALSAITFKKVAKNESYFENGVKLGKGQWVTHKRFAVKIKTR